jgi:hypothetical protein
MAKRQYGRSKKQQLRCSICGQRIEAQTTIRSRSGVVRTLSARPGDLTECEQCGSMLEYGGCIGALTVHRASPERVRAFQELENEGPAHRDIPSLVEYVLKFRRMPSHERPSTSGAMRFRFVLRS